MVGEGSGFDLAGSRSKKFASAQDSDVLVIGGGVNGLAVAWSAALSGLSVTVVDKGDWGSGTSSWSSRLIHGGLKYLEKLDVALVRESLADREWLLREAGHLVKPMPFLLPYVKGSGFPQWMLWCAMVIYDILSFDKSVPRFRSYSKNEVISKWRGVRTGQLQGGAVYYDAQVEDSERLCVELMLGARRAGATTINYARVSELIVEGTRVVGARVTDGLTGHSHEMRATVTANLAGAWLDSVFAGTPMTRTRWIGGTKGTHLAVRRPDYPIDTSVYFESDDGRPMMIIPWKDMLLLGSTDKRFEGDIDTLSADQDEIDYILFETNKMFPDWDLTEDDVHYWYTGLRPLPYVSASRTADITRRHRVVTHGKDVFGLVSVVGGKLTTFRALSRHVMTVIGKELSVSPVSIDRDRFPGAKAQNMQLSRLAVTPRLDRLYGALVLEIDAISRENPDYGRVIDEATGVTVAEVRNAVVNEEATSVSDVVARRTVIGLNSDLGASGVEAISREMAALLGWSEAEREASVTDYSRYLRRLTVKADTPSDV